jgi:prolyl 4-hydroxylase
MLRCQTSPYLFHIVMPARVTISPELREWILVTTRAGHGVPDVLRLMKDNGYDPRQSRSIVAEVLKLPLSALTASTAKPAPRGLRTRHPEGPSVSIGGQTIDVSLSVDAPPLRGSKACSARRNAPN